MSTEKQISWQVPDVEREDLEVDALIVGAGPAGLACAIHLSRLLAEKGMEDRTVLVLEKAEDIGYHTLSGAVMDPRGMRELFPDWLELECPVESEVRSERVELLRPGGGHKRLSPMLIPPPLHNEGNYVVSLYRVVRWMKEQAESLGVEVYPGFAGAEVLYDGSRVLGVQTRDAGVAKDGSRKGTFEPGMNVTAPVTVFAEGTRGSLARGLIDRLGLAPQGHDQIYATGIKELWEIPEERGADMLGRVIHTAGYPLTSRAYGGSWIYGQKDNRLSIGFVVALDHGDAKLDPHALFVKWKQHPAVQEHLQGGKVIRYGAKTIPEGGVFAMPRLQGDGFCLVGDTAGFLNAARLKGIHLGIKSGMLAAEAIAAALEKGDSSADSLAAYTAGFESSWAREELWGVRNWRQAFGGGMVRGAIDYAFQRVTGGRGLVAQRGTQADYKHMRPVSDSTFSAPTYDDSGSMDKLTDVYHSGAVHEEDQPPHLVVTEPDLCTSRCTAEYGNPCQHFCPAAVYEWPEGDSPAGVIINASNCVHCKTCDIADPYQAIQWVVPEAGGGPKYIDM